MATNEAVLRTEALNTAARLAMSSNLDSDRVLERAREFYEFLSGHEVADPTQGTFRLVRDRESVEF